MLKISIFFGSRCKAMISKRSTPDMLHAGDVIFWWDPVWHVFSIGTFIIDTARPAKDDLSRWKNGDVMSRYLSFNAQLPDHSRNHDMLVIMDSRGGINHVSRHDVYAVMKSKL